ncbi:hypothetical protein [Aquimarina aquimarini]|uniref:hypothetical protein n=1 Tax=Aquimarina aquimarini TaxID=1191734 RepID=UPI001F178716|nr:hypothetical protein [Aquimarina aquimarini]
MTTTTIVSEKGLKDIHLDILEWKSNLQFIKDETQFINQLLNSYVFEPTTPNLFERLQRFKEQMIFIDTESENIHTNIRKHESELGGMLECDTISCDTLYYKEHESFKKSFDNFYKNFKKLKSEIFQYAGSILRKNKK